MKIKMILEITAECDEKLGSYYLSKNGEPEAIEDLIASEGSRFAIEKLPDDYPDTDVKWI